MYIEGIENDFKDEIKIESEIRIQKSSLNETRFEMTNISNNKIESENNKVFDKDSNIESSKNELCILALKIISSLHSDATLSRIQIDRITRTFHLFLNTIYVNDIKKSLMDTNLNHVIEKFDIFQNILVILILNTNEINY